MLKILTKKTITIFTFILICLLLILSHRFDQQVQVDMHSDLAKSLNTILEITHQAVHSWQKEHRNAAKIWANTEKVRKATKELLGAKRDAETLLGLPALKQLRDWLEPVHVGKEYQGFFIIAPDNINLASARNHNVGMQNLLVEQPEFLATVRSGRTAMSLPLKSDVALPDKDGNLRINLPTMFVGAPIRDRSDRVIAVLTFRINPAEDFTTIFQKGWIGDTGETYAFDRRGRMISDSRYDAQIRDIGLISPLEHAILNIELRDPGVNLIKEGLPPKPARQQQPFTRMASSALKGESGSDLQGYRDYRGVPVVGVWRWDEELDMGIATELSREEAYKTLEIISGFIITLTIALILLLVGMMSIFSKHRAHKQLLVKLEKNRDELEEKVEERTEILLKANKELIIESLDRQKAEKELREERDLAESLIDTAQVIILWLDTEARIVRFNHYMEELSGYKLREVKGKDWFATFLPDADQSQIHDLFIKAITGQRTKGNINSIIIRNGSERIIEWYDKALRDEKGNIIGLIAIGQDITERRQAEEAVRKSEERYRNLVELSPDSIVVHEPVGRILFANSAAVRLAGADDVKQLTNRSVYDFIHPDFHDEAARLIAKMQKGMKLVGPVEQKLITLDGKELIVDITGGQLYFENKPAIHVIIRDISDRKQAERKLREERDKAQRYLDTVEAIILALDIEGNVTLINRKGCEILGYKEQELLGKNWFDTCLPQTKGKNRTEKLFQQIIDGKVNTPEYYENEIISRDGHQHLVAWHNSYLRDERGNVVGTLSSGDDITQRKQVERQTLELLQQNRELTQQLFQLQEEERQHIARELHDEFGQWLTAIQLNVQNITNLIGHQSPQVDASVETIINSANNIHDGIRGMIHSLRPALLDELGLKDSLRELINQWQEHNSDIDCQLILKGQLEKLGKNLSITMYRLIQEGLTNVSKHAKASKVVVQLECKNKANQDEIILSIEDDGKGMGTEIDKAGLGLPGMRERVLSSGGTFKVIGAVNGKHGVRIEAHFTVGAQSI